MAGSEESTLAGPPPGGAWKTTTPSASVLIDEFYRVRDITVQERLGGGSFGDVFRGLWNGSTLVALKQLKDSEQLKDFFREARMLKSLQHPNIVQFFGIFALNDQMYIVTEFMHKGSLETLLRRNRHLTPVELLGLARQAAAGMQYLEMANVVHRDLALRNLLVTAQGPDLYLVKIADFGLSRNVASDYYRASDMKIPIRWSAPEVLQYGIWTSKSDVFSMGVVLWEMFSFGSIPWPSKSNNDVLMLVLDGERMVPPKDCPVEVQEIMLLCWAQSPDDRPSFTELFKLIQQLLAEADASEPALDALNWTTPSASAESEHSRGPPPATDATALGADETASIALYNNA